MSCCGVPYVLGAERLSSKSQFATTLSGRKFDIVYLRLNSKAEAKAGKAAGIDFRPGIQLLKDVPQQGTQAYIVSVSGAKNILRSVRPMRAAIDMSLHHLTESKSINAFTVQAGYELVEHHGDEKRTGESAKSKISGSPLVASLPLAKGTPPAEVTHPATPACTD